MLSTIVAMALATGAQAQSEFPTVTPSGTPAGPSFIVPAQVPECLTMLASDVPIGTAVPCGTHGTVGIPVVVTNPGSGGGGGGSTTISGSLPAGNNNIGSTSPKTVTASNPAVTSGGAGTAANVFTAGSIVSGFDVVNTGTAVIYISLAGTASANSIPVQPGQPYSLRYGTAQALSVYSASAWTVAGQVF
jgi:hypothetical protein